LEVKMHAYSCIFGLQKEPVSGRFLA